MKSSIVSILVHILIAISCRSNEIEQNESEDQSKANLLSSENLITVPEECAHKILSGKLVEQMTSKLLLFEKNKLSNEELVQKIFVYLSSEPSSDQKEELNNLALKCDWDSWIPPAGNHPFGFLTVEIKIDSFEQVLCLEWIKKIDTAERESQSDLLE